MNRRPSDSLSPSADADPPREAVWELMALHRRLVDGLTEPLGRYGLTVAHAVTLQAVASAPDHEVTLSVLARSVGLNSGSLTRIVNRICDLGLMARRSSMVDGRVSYVSLTDAGRMFLTDVVAQGRAVIDRDFVDHLGLVWQTLRSAVPVEEHPYHVFELGDGHRIKSRGAQPV